VSPEDESSEDDESDEESEKGNEELDLDVRLGLDKSIFLVEQMLAEGRRGLEYRVRTSELPVGGRVLSDSD
jgi:hypothetical protein